MIRIAQRSNGLMDLNMTSGKRCLVQTAANTLSRHLLICHLHLKIDCYFDEFHSECILFHGKR